MLAIEPISDFSPTDVGGIGAESSRRLPRSVVVGRNPAGLEEKVSGIVLIELNTLLDLGKRGVGVMQSKLTLTRRCQTSG